MIFLFSLKVKSSLYAHVDPTHKLKVLTKKEEKNSRASPISSIDAKERKQPTKPKIFYQYKINIRNTINDGGEYATTTFVAKDLVPILFLLVVNFVRSSAIVFCHDVDLNRYDDGGNGSKMELGNTEIKIYGQGY